MSETVDVRALLGGMDIYLVDQWQRGRLAPGMRVLDAGCGGGRNVGPLLGAGFDVAGNDASREAVEGVREMAVRLRPGLRQGVEQRFRVEAVEDTSFEPESFDVVVCNAVLHFANGPQHFEAMLTGVWKALAPGGTFFARLASSIGIEPLVQPLGQGRYGLPDGSERFLVDQEALLSSTERLGAELLDPIKTTNVQNRRCMTTWVLRRSS